MLTLHQKRTLRCIILFSSGTVLLLLIFSSLAQKIEQWLAFLEVDVNFLIIFFFFVLIPAGFIISAYYQEKKEVLKIINSYKRLDKLNYKDILFKKNTLSIRYAPGPECIARLLIPWRDEHRINRTHPPPEEN